jgi:hypothetical protein
MQDQANATAAPKRVPWNKGKLTGSKAAVAASEAALCRFCSLIPGLGVKLSNDRPCRAHCSLRGRGKPSA